MSLSEQDQKYVAAVLDHAGAVMTGSHFVYASGMHGSAYVNKDLLYVEPHAVERLCRMMAMPFLVDLSGGRPPDAVVGPAVGGVILSQYVAASLATQEKSCEALYADKDDKGGYALKRGYGKRVTGKRVLVVEDILTTGASARAAVEAVRSCGGKVIGVAALVNRGNVTAKDVGDVPVLHTLLDIKLESFTESACPLCAQGVPINEQVGRGAEFLARKHGLVQ